MVISKSDARSYLENEERDAFGNKPFQGYRSSLNYQEELANAQINRQFGEAVGQAYNTAMQQRSAVLSSNLGQGYKEHELVGINQSIEEAYTTMLSQRAQSLEELGAEFDEAYSSVDEVVDTYSEHSALMSQRVNEYYDFLRENYADVLMNDAQWSGFLTDDYEVDAEGNPVYDEEGNLKYILDEEGNRVQRLKTLDELDERGYLTDENGNPVRDAQGNLQWLGLRDNEGNLTVKGVDFYDMMMNYYMTHQGAENFEDYLKREDAELYDWLTSPNPYFQDLSGANWGVFRTMVGLTSKDSTYTFIERFGGLTEGQVKNMFSSFDDRIAEMDKWNTTDLKDRPEKVREFVQGSVSDLQKFATDLGITEDDLGMSWDALNASILAEIQNQTSGAEMAGLFFGSTGAGALAGAGTGAALAGTVGSGAGPLGSAIGALGGALIGAVVGALGGLIGGSIAVDKARSSNKEAALKMKEAYRNALTALTAYSMNKRAEVQSKYYR